MVATNYNTIYLPLSSDGVYIKGMKYQKSNFAGIRERVFDGLEIKNITYTSAGIQLHFDYNDWMNAANNSQLW